MEGRAWVAIGSRRKPPKASSAPAPAPAQIVIEAMIVYSMFLIPRFLTSRGLPRLT